MSALSSALGLRPSISVLQVSGVPSQENCWLYADEDSGGVKAKEGIQSRTCALSRQPLFR